MGTQVLGVDRALARWMYETMVLIRRFEEAAERLFYAGRIHGTMHLCIGQEAAAVGVCAALEPGDYITSTHRGHGHAIAKGQDVNRMMAELMGKATGYCRGKGGSMHIADIEVGNLGANGIVAGGLGIACGAALALKMQERPQVVVAFFGDGAVHEGDFHEALNLAAIWKLPVVFACENNQYGMSAPVERMLGNPRIHEHAQAYGIPGVRVDGCDVLAVYQAAEEAVGRARNGGGPTLLEIVTYRYRGHSRSDAQRYRTREEVERWKKRDPIPAFRRQLEANGFDSQELDALEAAVAERIEAAVRYAEESPEPAPEDLLADVYAEGAGGEWGA